MSGPGASGETHGGWRSHLAEALRWSSPAPLDWRPALAGAVGMAGPIALGLALGNWKRGVAASLGGLAMSRVGAGAGAGDGRADRPGRLATDWAVATASIFTGAAIAGRGPWTAAAVVGLGAATGLAGGLSRPMAEACGRVLLLAIIAASIGRPDLRPIDLALLAGLGGAATAALTLALGRIPRGGPARPEPAPARVVPWRYRLRRWWSGLRSFSGWQYTARITLGLAAAEGMALAWGRRNGHWIVLTVALVVHRRLGSALGRALQRSLGTVLGVLAGGLFLAWHPPPGALVATIALLAAARPISRAGSYLVYAAVMTPLVLLLIDLERALSPSVLVDRLVATLAGCGIALLLGYAVWLPLLPPAEERPS